MQKLEALVVVDSQLQWVIGGQPVQTHTYGAQSVAIEGIFIHSFMNRHIGGFHVLETVNSAVISMGMEI